MFLRILLVNYTKCLFGLILITCDITYHIPTVANQFHSSIELDYSMTSIESTHCQAALAVSGAWKGSNTSTLYEQLGWESLTDRRWYRRLLQFYNIFHNLTPFYLKVLIPSPRRNLYGQRRDNVLLGETYMGSEEIMFS